MDINALLFSFFCIEDFVSLVTLEFVIINPPINTLLDFVDFN